jgi:hypothetical protein
MRSAGNSRSQRQWFTEGGPRRRCAQMSVGDQLIEDVSLAQAREWEMT